MTPRWLVLLALAGCPGRASPRAPEEPAEIAHVAVDAAVPDVALRVGDDLPLSGRIEFDIDKATLRPGSLRILDEAVAFLRAHPEILRVEIRAHLATDPDRGAYGRKLSQDRAESVRDYLVDQGVDPRRLTAAGYEDSVPLVMPDTEGAAVTNRRIELRILELRA